jgi:peptidoglycan hydrolase CwlO-like protein
MELDPPAHPSAGYTNKYDTATALRDQLEREQRRLERKQRALEERQAALESEQAQLEREGAALQRQQAALRRQAAELDAEQARLLTQEAALRRRAERLADRARPIVARLVFVLGRERLVRRRIEQTTDPDKLEILRRRLARLEAREARTRARLEPFVEEGRALIAEAERLRQEGAALERQADELRAEAARLEAQGAELQAQAAELRREGAALQRQAAQLQAEADRAKRQERRAKQLQAELTDILTKAGGDDRATDHRVVAVQDALTATPGVVGQFPPQVNKEGDAVTVSAIPERAPSSPATADLVRRLRSNVLPEATEGGGIVTHVGGSTASNVDLATKIGQRLPIVIATVVVLSFLLLMVAFHSVMVPLQAAVTNLLSVAAALGVLTAVFQWGWGLSLIGLDAPGDTVPIASYVPLMMFAVLFGLSMDYEVFLVSRISQQHAGGKEPRDAVPAGLGASARVISAAAFIMICVFASFVLNGDPTVKQFGVGLAVAVLLAGTMVVLLAPAMLVLFGGSVFRLPGLLDGIVPRIDVEGGSVEVAGSTAGDDRS